MILLQINTVINSGSTGRITEEIGETFLKNGHESFIAYGRGNRPSKSQLIKIGNRIDVLSHVLRTRITDRHGFGSGKATEELVKKIIEVNPDAIGLHNLHGYYINIEVLFNFLKQFNKPVVWTLHDCWAFTGHCTYFDAVECFKWQNECNYCPNKKAYPASFLFDNSKGNFYEKKELFKGVKDLTIVAPSEWLAKHVKNSFLSDYKTVVINNGVDLNIFSPSNIKVNSLIEKYELEGKKFILGVASTWDKRKGLKDFIELRKILSGDLLIVLIGLNENQIKTLPNGIIRIERTNNVDELASLYTAAEAFINPTYVDNFPTTNIEALACGTPVITYNTGGSPEAIDNETGIVVEKGNVNALAEAIKQITSKGKQYYSAKCRSRAERLYDKNDRYMDYLRLYENLVQSPFNKSF